jgi:hypothetical protein
MNSPPPPQWSTKRSSKLHSKHFYFEWPIKVTGQFWDWTAAVSQAPTPFPSVHWVGGYEDSRVILQVAARRQIADPCSYRTLDAKPAVTHSLEGCRLLGCDAVWLL